MDNNEENRRNKLKEFIKIMHESITGYNLNNNIRSESDLDFIVYETIQIHKKNADLDYDELFQKMGAFMMYEIATKHPFWDGNKRTALIIYLFYSHSGTNINLLAEKYMSWFKNWDTRDDEIVNFMLNTAAGKYNYNVFLTKLKGIFK
ncbi:MAG: Fic family protein [archaeon]